MGDNMGKRLGIIFLAVVVVAAIIITVTSLSTGDNQQPADTTGTTTQAPAIGSGSNEVNGDHVDDFLPGPSTTP